MAANRRTGKREQSDLRIEVRGAANVDVTETSWGKITVRVNG